MNTARRVPRGLLPAITLALGLGLGMLVQHFLESAAHKARTLTAPTTRGATASESDVQPPWGELETTEFSLDLSDEALPQIQSLLGDARWFFPGYSLQGTTNLLRACQFTEADLTRVMKDVEWEAVWPGEPGRGNTFIALTDLISVGVRVTPPPDLIFALGAPARQRIYSVLSASPENLNHRLPFRFGPEDFDSLLTHSRLAAEKIEIIRRLAYTNESTVCLADVPSLRHVLTGEEMKHLLKLVYQAPTFVMRLRLSPGTDVGQLARYWGQGGRERVIRPFLQGLSKTPGQPAVSVSFMLPAFARTHLYTFPDPARDPAILQKQGLWTALNFFNEQSDNRYLDDDYARQALQGGFAPTGRAPSYGDLIALTSPSGALIHASVYIADSVVFTRNGTDPVQPWVLMKIPDLVAKFGTTEQVQPVVYHRKPA